MTAAAILIIAIAGYLFLPGNTETPVHSSLPVTSPEPTVMQTTETLEQTTMETTVPLQPVDFVLQPSDMTNCGLTCRQLQATITNTGYETAHNVCITLTIQNSRNEIISLNGNPSLRQCIGDIAAGESKTEPITVNADCGTFGTKCIGETLTLHTVAASEEKTVQFADQQIAV